MTQEPATESRKAFSEQYAELIAWAFAEAKCSRWRLSVELLAEALRRSVGKRFSTGPASAQEVELYVKSLHLEDLALACACGEGLEGAWEYFVGNYRQQLYSAAGAILRAANTFDEVRARDLADSLYAELYGIRSSGGTPRKSLFEYFHGRSKLSTWLRAVLAQRHVDQMRTAKRTVSLETEERGDLLPSLSQSSSPPPPDPDRAIYLALLDSALCAALLGLPARQRLLVSYYYLDQFTLREIGTALGEHESTVSRELDRTRRQLRETVTNSLLRGVAAQDGQRAKAGLNPEQLKLAFERALEDWPFDLARVLAKGEARAEKKE